MNLYRLSVEAGSDSVKITHKESGTESIFEYATIYNLDSNMNERNLITYHGNDKDENPVYLNIVSTDEGVSIDILDEMDEVIDSTYWFEYELIGQEEEED